MQTREEIIDVLARASIQGRLGLFIGSGFSKAVTIGNAPTWLDLLEEVCGRLKLDMKKAQDGVGTTFPRIASRLVAQIEKRLIKEAKVEVVDDGRFRKRALWKFKFEIAKITKELQVEDRESWRQVLEDLHPAWIVTTNYDLLIEEILPHTTTLRPSEVMSHSRGGTPVYHMHGHQEEPRAIVITEEDYTRLFRPGEYRQQKLPILIAESIVLFLGYGLGDTNILTAIDLASMYRTPDNTQLVQALWTGETDEKDPYKGESKETVVEIFAIGTFFGEIESRVLQIREQQAATLQKIRRLQGCPTERRKLADADLDSWQALVRHARENESSKEVFDIIDSLTKELEEETNRDWPAYKKLLTVFIYSLVGLGARDGRGVHPALVAPLYDAFTRISTVLDPEEDGQQRLGYAWEASTEWHKLKVQIPEPLVRQFRSRALAKGGEDGDRVERLLKELHQSSCSECEECGASISTTCQTCGAATEIHCHDCGWKMR